MTDLHTHILPGMDDGASDPAMSLGMLRMEASQGVRRVVLTPHFYGNEERISHFLARRRNAWERLGEYLAAKAEEDRSALPELVLGAEVAWMPNMNTWDDLEKLRLGKSSFFLLELPFYPWSSSLIDQLYDLMGCVGVTPVLAHLERYFSIQRQDHLRELFAMGIPIQFSAGGLLHFLEKRKLLRILRRGGSYILASDCHDLTCRKPNLGLAVEVLRKSMSEMEADQLISRSGRLLQV